MELVYWLEPTNDDDYDDDQEAEAKEPRRLYDCWQHDHGKESGKKRFVQAKKKFVVCTFFSPIASFIVDGENG